MKLLAILAAALVAAAATAESPGAELTKSDTPGVSDMDHRLSSMSESPGGFITRILKDEINGNWSLQWQSLHPGHKALISQAQYVACSRMMGTDFATGREVFRVLGVRDDPIAVRGVPQRTSKLVTITFRQREKTNGLTYHMHAVRVGDRWVWILGKRFLNQVERGRCLDGSPLQRR